MIQRLAGKHIDYAAVGRFTQSITAPPESKNSIRKFEFASHITATVLALENAELRPDGKGFPLAINLNSSLLGNQREGEITAEAQFVRNGKRIAVIRTQVTGTQGRLLAEVTTTHIPAF